MKVGVPIIETIQTINECKETCPVGYGLLVNTDK